MPDKIKAVLVGCGGISRAWLGALSQMPEVEVVGLVDVVEEAAHNRAEEFNLGSAFIGSNLESVLAATAPDVVFNCTIPEAHVEVTLEALSRGCHVLTEKPLADTLQGARRLVEAAASSGKMLAVMQNYRYNRGVRALKGFLDEGVIGSPHTVNVDFYIGAHFGGFRDHMRHVLLVDMAIHIFDMARFITGADPVSVYCKEWNPEGSWYDHGASAVAVFELSGGLVFNFRGSWCAEGLNTSWSGQWRVIGPKGSVSWDGEDGFRAQVVKATGGFLSELEDVQVPPYEGDKVGGHAGLIRDFVQAVLSGGQVDTVASDNIRSLAMVFAAVDSAERRLPVDITI